MTQAEAKETDRAAPVGAVTEHRDEQSAARRPWVAAFWVVNATLLFAAWWVAARQPGAGVTSPDEAMYSLAAWEAYGHARQGLDGLGSLWAQGGMRPMVGWTPLSIVVQAFGGETRAVQWVLNGLLLLLCTGSTWLVARELFDRRLAYVAGTIAGLTPPLLATSLYFFPGHLAMGGIAGLTVLFALRWARRGSAAYLALTSATMAWGLLCRPLYVLLYVTPALLFVAAERVRRPAPPAVRRLLLEAGVFLLPLLAVAPRYWVVSGDVSAYAADVASRVRPLWKGQLLAPLESWGVALFALVLLGAVASFRAGSSRHSGRMLFGIVWLAGGAIACAATGADGFYYQVGLIPALAVVAAVAFDRTLASWWRRAGLVLAAACFVVIVSFSTSLVLDTTRISDTKRFRYSLLERKLGGALTLRMVDRDQWLRRSWPPAVGLARWLAAEGTEAIVLSSRMPARNFGCPQLVLEMARAHGRALECAAGPVDAARTSMIVVDCDTVVPEASDRAPDVELEWGPRPRCAAAYLLSPGDS